jgi:phosphohistidine phosphatase SixA
VSRKTAFRVRLGLLAAVLSWVLFALSGPTLWAQGNEIRFVRGGSAISNPEELAAALRRGGMVLFLSHAQEDGADANPLDLEDCGTQQALTPEGRSQAIEIGEQIREQGVPIGPVLTSAFCRTYETAVLAFGPVEVSEILTPLDALTPSYPSASLRALIGTAAATGTNTVLVSHSAVLMPLGIGVERAETAVFEPLQDGRFNFVALIPWQSWAALPSGD